MSHFKRFEYSSEDLKQNLIFQSNQQDEKELFSKSSRFDDLLLSEWHNSMENGAFKYKLDENLPTKYLPGKFAFLVQVNVMRYIGKRPSEIRDCSLNQPFDPNKFNFTKISPNEVLFELINTDNTRHSNEENEKGENHVIINNSPIELGHILICPRRKSCLNQVIDAEALKLALEISLLSSLNIISGFNSLNSHSSVNHLHIQAYYLKHKSMRFVRTLPIQNVRKAEQFHNRIWFIGEEEYIFPGFALQLCDFQNDVELLAKSCFEVVNYLHKNNIPHNLVIIKCEEFMETETILDDKLGKITLRVVIWPKKPEFELIPNDLIIGFAICELAGHFLLQKEEQFDQITEMDVTKRADECKMDKEKFEKVKNDLRSLTL